MKFFNLTTNVCSPALIEGLEKPSQASFCISHLSICTFTSPTNTENPDKNQFEILLSSLQVLSTQTPEKERGLPALQVIL